MVKAKVLNNRFFYVFTEKDVSEVSCSFPTMTEISFNIKGVYNFLNSLELINHLVLIEFHQKIYWLNTSTSSYVI